jgi:beta-1,4-mannosyltransferase
MLDIYLYPRHDIKTVNTPNPYIINFEASLTKNHNIVNKSFNNTGVIDCFKYIFKADLFIFNWIENLSLRRYGILQIFAFQVFLIIVKLLGKKILWVLHNKYTHDEARNRLIDFMFKVMMRNSHFILTHSKSGIDFVKEKFPMYLSKVRYITHPVKRIYPEIDYNDINKKIFDFLIWGVILPYKGVLQFLRYVKNSNEMSSFKILIVGECLDNKYKMKLNEYLSETVIHLDKYYTIERIAGFAANAKVTLFTYNPETILSSGSLMDSIGMGSMVIGPDAGAFRDLSIYSFVKTYNTYSDIIDIMKNYGEYKDSFKRDIESFCKENGWDLFVEKLVKKFNITAL